MLRDQLRGSLIAYARDARDVVRRVALERFEVDHLVGPQAVALTDHLLVVDHGVLEALPCGHQLHERRDQLEGIEVAGHDDGLKSLSLGLSRERSDDVVGLVARQRVHRHAEFLEQLLYALELRS